MSTYNPGDWLIDIKGNQRPLNTIFKVEDEYTRYRAADVRPWQPKPGDWCWFWLIDIHNNLVGGPICGKLSEIRIKHGLPRYYISGVTDEEWFNHCEPFIGQLPSICKE